MSTRRIKTRANKRQEGKLELEKKFNRIRTRTNKNF